MNFDFFTPSWITLKCRAKKNNAYHTTLIITRGPTLLCELGSLFIANTLLLNCAYYKKFISIIPSHYRFVVSIGKKSVHAKVT